MMTIEAMDDGELQLQIFAEIKKFYVIIVIMKMFATPNVPVERMQ